LPENLSPISARTPLRTALLLSSLFAAINYDVDGELNRAIDWLQAEGIGRVILTGDFHLSTQLIGADTRSSSRRWRIVRRA
jgi:hypothetical protein